MPCMRGDPRSSARNGDLTIRETSGDGGRVHFVVLRDGRIHFEGTREELLASP